MKTITYRGAKFDVERLNDKICRLTIMTKLWCVSWKIDEVWIYEDMDSPIKQKRQEAAIALYGKLQEARCTK